MLEVMDTAIPAVLLVPLFLGGVMLWHCFQQTAKSTEDRKLLLAKLQRLAAEEHERAEREYEREYRRQKLQEAHEAELRRKAAEELLERQRREEEEQLRRIKEAEEEEERRKQAEIEAEIRRKLEEEEAAIRKKLEEEEAERRRQAEEEERLRREAEEEEERKRLAAEEAERKRLAEEEEERRKQAEEAERLRIEAEEEEERRKQAEEEERKRQEELEAQAKKEAEEEARRKQEEEEAQAKAAAEAALKAARFARKWKSQRFKCIMCDNHTRHRCSRCKNVYYCSGACQSQDWAEGHKHECQGPPAGEGDTTGNAEGDVRDPVEPEEKVVEQTDQTVAAYRAPVRSPAPIHTAAINYSLSVSQEGILLRPSSMGIKDRRRSKPKKLRWAATTKEVNLNH